MTTTAFPAITPSAVDVSILHNTRVFASPLNGTVQTSSRSGSRIRMVLTFRNLQGANRGVLQGFLAFQYGQVNRIEIGDPSYQGARGALGGTPLVNGADQTGVTLVTDGWPSNTLVLRAGDYISYDNGTYKELKMVTSDGTSDGSGNLTISVMPEIHISPANNAAIETADPVGYFMLATRESGWTNVPGQSSGTASPMSDFTVDLIEDIGTA